MKYYWIKLRMDFFSSPEMQWLLKQPDGSNYVMIYLRLCMEAAKNDTDTLVNRVANFYEPYTWEDLAQMTGFSVSTVKMGLGYLVKLNLLVINNDLSIYLPRARSMVGSEKIDSPTAVVPKLEHKRALDRERQRRHRAKKKLESLQAGQQPKTFTQTQVLPSASGLQFDPNAGLSSLIGKNPSKPDFLP